MGFASGIRRRKTFPTGTSGDFAGFITAGKCWLTSPREGLLPLLLQDRKEPLTNSVGGREEESRKWRGTSRKLSQAADGVLSDSQFPPQHSRIFTSFKAAIYHVVEESPVDVVTMPLCLHGDRRQRQSGVAKGRAPKLG